MPSFYNWDMPTFPSEKGDRRCCLNAPSMSLMFLLSSDLWSNIQTVFSSPAPWCAIAQNWVKDAGPSRNASDYISDGLSRSMESQRTRGFYFVVVKYSMAITWLRFLFVSLEMLMDPLMSCI